MFCWCTNSMAEFHPTFRCHSTAEAELVSYCEALTAGRIREAIEGQPSFPGGSWKLNHLKGAELVADGVTKPLMGQSFEDFQQDLGMKSGPQVKSMFGASGTRSSSCSTGAAGGWTASSSR